MANLLSWLGGVANGIGGQINRTANQVQRNVVNPAVNFGVRNVQQAQRNVAQLPANVQRGAFDLQQQANNARKQAEEEARRIAEQRTREIMSIGNQAQQGFRQTSNMVTAPVRVLNKSSQGVKVGQSQVVQDLIPTARLAKTVDLAIQGKFIQAAQNTMRVPFASGAADIIRQMAANSADQYHAGPKIPGVNLPTRAEIEDNKIFARSVENAGNKTIGAVQNAPGVRKVLDGQLPGGFTLRQAGAFANDSIAKPTLMQANDMGEAIAGNNDQARLDRLGYTNDLKGASKLVYDTVSLASLGYPGTKAMQLVKAPTLGGALKIAPSVAARQFGSGVAQNTALQLSQGTPVQQLDPMQIALAGGTYALLGTGLPLTGKVAGKGLSKVGQAIDIQRAKPIMSAIETQKFADTMRKVTPQTAPDIPTKGKMVSQGYQDVSVDFKPKPVTNDFTGSILDNANYQLRNGQISEKQYKAFIVDDYTKRTGKLPTDEEVQGFINVAKEQPYAKLEQLRQQYSKPVAETAPKPKNIEFKESTIQPGAKDIIDSNKYIGTVDYRPHPRGDKIAFIDNITIADENTGKGYGTKVIKKIFDDNPNLEQVQFKPIESSVKFWEKNGAKELKNGYYGISRSDTTPQVGRAVGDVSAFDKTKRLEPGVKPGSVVDRMTNDKAYIDKINRVNAQQKNANGKTFGRSNNLYHTTSADNLDSIRQNGLTPGKTQRFEGVGSSDKLSFGANEKTAQYYGKQGDVMIRTKASYVPEDLQADLLAGGTGAYTSKSNIPASQLEVKVNGKWQPLVDSAKNKPTYELVPKPGKTPMKPGSDSFKTDTVENIIKDLKGVSQEFRDKVGSNINKNISVEEVPFSKLIRTKTPASKRLSSVEKLGSTDYVTVIKEGNRYRPVDGQHRIAVAENSGKSSLKMIVANSDSNMTTEQIKNQFGKAIAPEPKETPVGKQVLPKGINKDDVVEAHQFGSTTKGMVGNDTDIAIFLDPKHPSFTKIGSEYNKKVGKTEYHVFPDNDEGHAVFDAMLDYKDPKYGTGKGIAVKLNKDTIFSTDNIKKDRFGVPFKEESVPVAKLTRNQEYQPRIGQSGEATTANVFKKGYQEGLSDQPMLVRKEGDKYTVLGGHSRTMGIEQRAKAGLDNPTNIKARVYENITDEQARQISRGANQGAQYESTLDMAKSISASISENKAPSVQKQNMVKGFGHDDYKYLWDVVKDNNILKEKVNAGGISAEETLAIARQGRVKGLEPEKVAGVIQGLDKAGKLTRQNAKNVINLLSGKIKAGQMRTNQIGMFGDVEKAVKAVDLLDEYQKVSAELVKKRNALAIATDTLDKKSPAYKELRLKVKEYGQKLKTVETEVVNQYNAKISKNVPEIPSKTPPPPKPPTKKVRMNEYGELQVKERGFVTTVKNSPQTTPEVAKGVKGKYEPINNIDTLDTARKEVGLGKSGRVNNKKAYEEAIDTAKRSEDYSTETQAQSLILIEHLQSKGRTQDAIDIVEKMSERATKNGQASQILAAYNRLKPEGVLMMAQREIDKAKAMNPTKYADLKIEKVQAKKLRAMATRLQTLTGDERIVAQKEMLDEIGRLVPTPNMTKAVTLWKAGLLTGIKGGVSGNAVGNASNILVKKIADAPASAIDTVITQFTGNRSKVFTLKGWLSGFGEGLKAGKKQIQLGTGADDLASKLDYKKVYFSKNNPAGRFAQKYTDFVFGFYSASDKPWKMAALKNSLVDLATVEAKNKGLKGTAKAKFIKETVEAPPDNLLVQATNDSLDATFQDATALGGMLSGAKRSLAKHGPVAGAVGEVVAPFTGIPSSVATKMYRYSLVSSAVDIVRAIKASNKGQFDQAAQRKVSESIGKGLTGTALLGTGYALWNAGLMTTGMPQDPQERDLWELEGKQPWSVKVGGEWLSLNYTGPVLAILGAGATAAQSIKEGNTLPQTAFIAGMGTAKAVLESSPLRGVQGTLDVISDPARNGPRYLESLAGSTIPTISADVASSIDPLQREAMSPLDAMTNRVPIWRYGLNPKLNPFGEPKTNNAFGIQAIVDPFRMSEARTSSLTTELRNLYNTNKDLGTMPSDFKKDFYGGDTKLNEKQIYDLTVKIKPEIKQAWEQIIADPRYQGLSPEQRKKVLDKAAEDIRAARKFETGVQGGFLNEGEARKKLETGAKRILRGGQTDYINKETGGEDTPKQKYETALNDYEDKKKNGEISSIDEIKTQKALRKLEAQSNFDQDTVDLYGLTLKEIDGYLKSQPNGGDIYQKLLALDDAMEATGATRKFKNRKLVVSSGKKSTKGRKTKKGGKAKKGTAIKIPSIKGSTYKTPKFVTRKIASRKLSTKALPKIKAGKVYV